MKPKYRFFVTMTFVLALVMSCDKPVNFITTSKSTTNSQAPEQTNQNKDNLTSFAGTYSFGEDIEKGPIGSILIYPLNETTALFYLDVSRGAPSYNMAQLFGQMTLNGNKGTYDSYPKHPDINCELHFEFTSDKLKVRYNEEKMDCGFGDSVNVGYIYKLVDSTKPTHFFTGEGEKIFFENLAENK